MIEGKPGKYHYDNIEKGKIMNKIDELPSHCDICHSKIRNESCDCGIWIPHDSQPHFIKLLDECAVEYSYLCEKIKCDKIISGDHYSGSCFIFFKGDEELIEKVREFIESQKSI